MLFRSLDRVWPMTNRMAPMDLSDTSIQERLERPQRLAALVRTGLLDTPPEANLDQLTRLAAAQLGVPSTFISLVDRERDFYKSHFGFGEPLDSVRQLEGRTFCHYAISSDEPLVIDDTTRDPLYRSVPTVTTLGVRSLSRRAAGNGRWRNHRQLLCDRFRAAQVEPAGRRHHDRHGPRDPAPNPAAHAGRRLGERRRRWSDPVRSRAGRGRNTRRSGGCGRCRPRSRPRARAMLLTSTASPSGKW